MDDKPFGNHFLAEWREFKAMSLREVEEAATRFGADKTFSYVQISRVCTGRQPYTERTLGIFAQIFGCTVAELLTVNPLSPNPIHQIGAIAASLPGDMQAEALRYVKYLRDSIKG